MANQLPGEKQTPPQHSKRGQVNFTAYSKQGPRTHKASNMGETAFHNVSLLFNYAQPGRFSPSSRSGVFGYTEIMDNERVRGWRLVLDPGQTAAPFTQTAPGLRIVLDGGEIAEIVAGQPDRGMNLRLRGILLARTWYDACDSQPRKNPSRAHRVRTEVGRVLDWPVTHNELHGLTDRCYLGHCGPGRSENQDFA